MTTEQVGAYILLLAQAWHETPPCSVPDDDDTLARWTQLGADAWSRNRSKVVACFEARDGRLYSPRLELEWRKLRAYQKRQSENGKKGGQASVERRLSGGQAVVEHPLPSSPSHSTLESIPPPARSLEPRAAEGIRNLKVSVGVRRELEGCVDISVSELCGVIEAIRARGDARDEDAVVAAELLRRRGKSMPTRKGPLARPLALARSAMPEINGLAAIVNNRRRG